MERNVAENLLIGLEERGYPFPAFRYCKEGGRLKRLGKGGSSVVYELYNQDDTDKRYAMKVIGFTQNRLTAEAFWKSVNIQSVLCDNSPYVVRSIAGKELCIWVNDEGSISEIREASADEDIKDSITLQFILMEKLEDIMVVDRFRHAEVGREELKEEKEVLKLATQISQALLVAHENNILHRDVKLENIFWDKKEACYKLGDFGISKLTESGTAETVVFSEGYGAPEITMKKGANYNQTADIYSLGISLYLLLNNMKFPGSNGYYANRVQYDPEFVFPAPDNASEAMTRIIRKMCSYWREDRYQSMAELVVDLKEVGEALDMVAGEEDIPYMDLATETFTGDKETELFDEELGEKPNEGEVAEEYQKPSTEKSRYKRKKDEKILEEIYKNDIVKYFIGFTFLFMLLFRGVQTDSSMMLEWQFWALPIAVFIEAILLRVKEFHITFGLGTILLGVYCMTAIGINIPHVALIICVLTGMPIVTSAATLATGIWMFLMRTGDLSWLEFISEKGLSWILIILLLMVLYSVVVLEWDLDNFTELHVDLWSLVFWIIPIAMIITGFILKRIDGEALPELIRQFYFIRTGIIFLIVRAVGFYRNIV